MDQDAQRVPPDDTMNASHPEAASHSQTPKSSPAKPERSEPHEPLPTDRVAFDKQMQFLLAYAAASQNGTKSVTNHDVAALVKMQPSTVSLANPFFVKCGFLIRHAPGYVPVKEVLEYQLAVKWNDPNAPHKIAGVVSRTWFAQLLRPKLEMRSVEENEAIGDLAQKAVVTRERAPQLRTLLDYMEGTGIIRREGSLLVLNRGMELDMDDTRNNSPPSPTRQNVVPLSGLGTGRGAIQFAVNIDVDMAEIATWRPERITAFFSGLAAVVAAKKGDDEPPLS